MKLPLNETRKFTSGKLNNMIKYTIIQDDTIDKACVSVAIKVGSISDPVEYQGLAHFLEHMLFLGSKKYPKENYFQDKLKCNGGNSNAFTSTYETVYYFSVIDKFLTEILDIFSRFFIDPLFNKDSVDREINAINSEHMKNINNDMWITQQIILNLSKKNSIINKFATGNLSTLNKKGVREKMIEFHKKYYCSENICVSIISPRPNNVIEKIFTNIFNNIPHKKCKELTFHKYKPFYDIKQKEYQLIPVNDKNYILYFWEIPLPFKYLKNIIFDVIDYVIENNDKHNLEHYLLYKGLIKSLGSYIIPEGVLILQMDINKKDSKNIKDTIRKINGYVKYYFNNLTKLNWKKIYDNYKKKYDILFDYTDKEDELSIVKDISINMHYFEPENYYNGGKVVLEKEHDILIKHVENINFNNANIIYIIKDKLDPKTNFIKDKYYNNEYGELSNTLANINELQFDFNIDTDNSYYNIKPKFYKNLDQFIQPTMIKRRTWYGGVSKFKEHRINNMIILSHYHFYDSIENYILTKIGCNIINFYLSKHFNKEEELGFIVRLSTNVILSNILLNITGLNDKFFYFFNNIFKYFKKLFNKKSIKNKIIKNEIEEYKENLLGVNKLIPWEYINIKYNEITNKYSYPTNKLLDYLNNVDEAILIKKLLHRIYYIINLKDMPTTMLFYGNLEKNMILSEMNLTHFNNGNRQSLLMLPNYGIPIPKQIQNITIKHPNKNEKNKLVQMMFHSGLFTPNKNIKLMILSKLIDEPCYDYLRTKNQLGYLVRSYMFSDIKDYYLVIKVQSTKNTNFIEKKINSFLEMFGNMLENSLLSDKSLAKVKDTIKQLLLEKETNTAELFEKYSYEILTRKYMFNRNELLVQQLKNITKNDIINYFNKLINNKIVIKIE